MKILYLLLISVFILEVQALDNKGIRNARNLLKEKRYNEAIAIYKKMVENTKKIKEKQYYTELAIRAALKSKDKKKAEELIGMLDDPMRQNFIFMKFFAPKEVIAKASKLDLSKMPKDVISDAYALRGIAFLRLKNNERALGDLKKALDYSGGKLKGISAKYIGDMYVSQGDEKAAEEYYSKAVASTSGAYSWRCASVTDLSKILIKKGEAEKALALYSDALLKRANNRNKALLYAGKADVLEAADKKSEALSALESAVKYADGKYKEGLKKRLNKLAEDML